MNQIALKIADYLPEVLPQWLMKEEFLHYLWQLQHFDRQKLKTTQGESIEIHHPGIHNFDSGPDFHNARLRIGNTLWAGNVELHVHASEWIDHQHQTDNAYDNVILHVVYEEDQVIFRRDGARIPCLELKRRIPTNISGKYMRLLNNRSWIPCQKLFSTVPAIKRALWLDRLLVERLEHNTRSIAVALEHNKGDWESTFYQYLARSFGLHINTAPFELMARSLPLKILLKHKNNPLQIEALLFGQAGLLDASFEDSYPQQLKKEYTFLQAKYQLKPIVSHSWKYSRLRPANFPTIRIAQFAAMIYQTSYLFSKILAVKNVKEVENAFDIKLSNYWLTHYRFDKLSARKNKRLGKNHIHLLIINTIVPFLFIYGKRKADERFQEQALRLLEELKPEQNHIIDGWKKLGLDPESAYETQALLQLKKVYCNLKRCLQCTIGNAILKA